MTNPNPHTVAFTTAFGPCATLAYLDPFQVDGRTRCFLVTVRDSRQGIYTANCSDLMSLASVKTSLQR